MKKILVLIAITVVAFSVNAQDLKETEIPDAIKIKFVSLYPNIQKVKWERENGLYEAEFKLNKVETSVLFETNGSLIQTETEIAVSSLPAAVSDYVSKNFPVNSINEATKILDVNGKITYEAEVGKSDYLFDENGNLLNKEIEKSDDDNDSNNDNINDND